MDEIMGLTCLKRENIYQDRTGYSTGKTRLSTCLPPCLCRREAYGVISPCFAFKPASFSSHSAVTGSDMAAAANAVDGEMIDAIRAAVKDCADRGLHYASKWCVALIVHRFTCRAHLRPPGQPSSSPPSPPQGVATPCPRP
jgi:hypothetical protein